MRPEGPQLISQMVRRLLGIDCCVLMGANIATVRRGGGGWAGAGLKLPAQTKPNEAKRGSTGRGEGGLDCTGLKVRERVQGGMGGQRAGWVGASKNEYGRCRRMG